MSSYVETLQDEEYRPSSRATSHTRSTSARRRRNREEGSNSSPGTDHLEGSSSYGNDYDDYDHIQNNSYHTEDNVPSRQPVGRNISRNLAHHTRTSVPKSTSKHSTLNYSNSNNSTRVEKKDESQSKTKVSTSGPAINQTKTGKKKPATRTANPKKKSSTSKAANTTKRKPGTKSHNHDSPSERSSIYSTGRSSSGRGRYDNEANDDDDDDPFRPPTSGNPLRYYPPTKQSEPSIYEAYRRLSTAGPFTASQTTARTRGDDHAEEEQSSNYAYSQQTPATSSSTQPSSYTEEEEVDMLQQSPSSKEQTSSSSSAKRRSTAVPKKKTKKQPPANSSVGGTSKSSKSQATSTDETGNEKKKPPTIDDVKPYQRKNSRNSNSQSKRGKREKAGSRNGTTETYVDPDYDEKNKNNTSNVPKHVMEELVQPSLLEEDEPGTPTVVVQQQNTAPSDPQRIPVPKRIPTRSTDLTPTSSKKGLALKNSLHSGSMDSAYSMRMVDVKNSLREEIELPRRKSSMKKRRGSATSLSSSASSSSGFALLEFLHHKKAPLTEEERRRRGNPFLNRPKSFKRHTGVGYYEGQDDDSSHDHMDGTGRRRSVSGKELDDNFVMDESSKTHHRQETLQEKYCPLPKPVRLVQQFCAKIVTNQEFQIGMVVLIMLNALILGIATYDFANPAIHEALDIIDRILLTIFTIELALQFGYCGYTLLLDGWLVFDTLTIVTSWWLEGVQVFRSFRIFRSFRLIVRLPLLKNLVLTVFHVMPRIYSILGLMILILYIFGVLCTILFGDLYEDGFTDQNYFGRLDYSVYTLFQMITLEGWGDVVRQVSAVHEWYASLIFSVFIVVTGFIMYNLIVAVMCDSMLVVEAQAREEARAKKRAKLAIAERLEAEEEKKLEEEMFEQRKVERQLRGSVKGVVSDDPSLAKDGMTLATMDSTSKDSVVEMREHMCVNCGFCSEIPSVPASVRRRNWKRDRLMEDNQARVRGLKQKVDQLVGTQQQMTAVLQTLMFEIEAQHKDQGKTSKGNASFSSQPDPTETSTGSSKFTS